MNLTELRKLCEAATFTEGQTISAQEMADRELFRRTFNPAFVAKLLDVVAEAFDTRDKTDYDERLVCCGHVSYKGHSKSYTMNNALAALENDHDHG